MFIRNGDRNNYIIPSPNKILYNSLWGVGKIMGSILTVHVSKEEVMATNQKLIQDFLALKEQQRTDKKCFEDYKRLLDDLNTWANGRPFETICKDQKAMVAFFAQLRPREEITRKLNGKEIKCRKVKEKFNETTIYFKQTKMATFIRWMFELGKREEVKSMNWIVKPDNLGRVLEKDDILTPEEVLAMSQAADNMRDRAIPLALFETMVRNAEFRQWNIEDVLKGVKDGFAKIRVKGKGNIRYNAYLVESLPAVLAWCENHPLRAKEGKQPIWVSLGRGKDKYGHRISPGSLNTILRNLAERAGVKKKVTAHILRHSGITWKMKNGFNPQILKKCIGHKQSSNVMMATYTHLFDEDEQNEILKHSSISPKQEPVIKIEKVACPQCGTEWPPGQKVCLTKNCNRALDAKLIMQQEKNETGKIAKMIEKALEEKGVIKATA